MSVRNAFLFEKRTAAEDNNDNQQDFNAINLDCGGTTLFFAIIFFSFVFFNFNFIVNRWATKFRFIQNLNGLIRAMRHTLFLFCCLLLLFSSFSLLFVQSALSLLLVLRHTKIKYRKKTKQKKNFFISRRGVYSICELSLWAPVRARVTSKSPSSDLALFRLQIAIFKHVEKATVNEVADAEYTHTSRTGKLMRRNARVKMSWSVKMVTNMP